MGAINVATISEIVPSGFSCMEVTKAKKVRVSPTANRAGGAFDSPIDRPSKQAGSIKIIIEYVDEDEDTDHSETVQKQDKNFLALAIAKKPTASIMDELEAEEESYRERKSWDLRRH